MRIGLLTYHSAANFGANLQALSTVSCFKNLGHEVIVINWVPEDLEEFYKKNVSDEQYKVHVEFVNNYFNMSELCRTSDEVRDVIIKHNIERVIIGSDAVFSYIPFLKRIHPSRKTLIGISNVTTDHRFPNAFWGDFLHNGDEFDVVAMSASAQYLDFSRCFIWTKNNIRRHLERFKYISVRDRATKAIVDNLLGSDVEITPDPVFAFNDNFKQTVTFQNIREKFNLPEKYVIFSFCKKLYSEEWYESLYNLFKSKGYTIVNLAMPEGCVDINSDIEIDVPLNPLDWYNIIRYSSGYIGQRMHPMIVALHNKVPVYIFDHYVVRSHDSSKIYDLLERFNMLNHYCNIKSAIVPNPSDIYDSISNFDKLNLEVNLVEMSRKYKQMINIISSC